MSTIPRLTPTEYYRQQHMEPLTQDDVRFITTKVAAAMAADGMLPAYLCIDAGTHDVEVSVPFAAFDAWVEALGGAVKRGKEMTPSATYLRAELGDPLERVVVCAYRPRGRTA